MLGNKITITEYAKLYGKSTDSVRQYIRTGRLKAEKVNGKWYIDEKEPSPQSSRITDLTKMQFGLLTVRERAGKMEKGNKSLWLCDCKCGGTKIVSGNNLRNGYTKSCGCIGNNKNETDVKGKTYGRLTPIRPTKQKDSHGSTVWECRCGCGNPNPVFASVRYLIGGSVTSCGCKKVEAGYKMQPRAVAGAKKSPKSGKFETNVNAKHWVLIAPDGVKYECTNLFLWARGHTELFGFEPGEKSANKIRAGFSELARSMRGCLKRPVYTYKGWRLDCLPEFANQGKDQNSAEENTDSI